MGKIAHGLVLFGIALLLPRAFAADVLTQHNDLARTGANTAEFILTPTNVATSFGELFTNSVDGQVYAQPLYIQNMNIAGGVHNVVFVCTENNSVYAFDADQAGTTYWHVNLGTPFTPPCNDLVPVIGITGTPVIDLTSGTLYVDTKLESGATQELHALSITNGAEKFGGPVTITNVNFDPYLEHQRTGLLLLNKVVYVCFASHCDEGVYHGFIFGYDATNLSQRYVYNSTPIGSGGGIWSSGMAPAADSQGNIYVMTGNGTFDGTTNFSMSMIKLSSHLAVEDYATPANWSTLNQGDQDFGSGGPVLLPTHYVVGIGKDVNLCLANANNLGHVGNWVQTFAAEPQHGNMEGQSPVYWHGPSLQYLFVSHANDPTESFQFTGTNINTTPLGISGFTQDDRSGGLSLSANGDSDGILWEVGSDNNLRAYDAVHFPNVLWMGSIGNYVKSTCPTIANGKVFVGTTDSLTVWGLTNYLYIQNGLKKPVLSWSHGATLLQSTSLSGKWTTNSATSPYTITPTNKQMYYRLLVPNN